MPASRVNSTGSTSSAPKRRLPFKPPGPAKKSKASAAAPTTAKSAKPARKPPAAQATNRGKGKKPAVILSSDTEDEDEQEIDIDNDDQAEEPATRTREPASRSTTISNALHALSDDDEDEVLNGDDGNASPPPGSQDQVPGVPPPLLTRLLYESFIDKKMKIGKQANEVMVKYVDTFIREAVARAALGKKERMDEVGARDMLDDDWLDVEDLERVAPGLLLDF